jgi:hypothetical protein
MQLGGSRGENDYAQREDLSNRLGDKQERAGNGREL